MSSANAAAAQQLANRAESGGPLDALLQQFEFQEAQELLSLIMSELSAGINPVQMARDISNTMDSIDYGRAETIARTESLTSWNDAALENYRANSDIVGSWMWMCMPGAGTCVSCLEEDGTIYSLDEELDDHPNGRCCKAPVTNDYGSILDSYGIPFDEGDFGPGPWDDRQTGEEWLLAQDGEVQRQAFGSNAAYNAWQSGDVPLKDFVKIRHDPVYGDSIQQQSLRGMGLNARDYSAGSMAERAAKEAEAKAQAEREAELAVAEERLTTAQARWDAVRGELPEHPLYVSDSGGPGAVPSKVMSFSDYAEQRRALLELWDAQALADAAKGLPEVERGTAAVERAAPRIASTEAERAALADAQRALDDLHNQWLAAQGSDAERDLRYQMLRQQYEVEKAQAALDRANGGRGVIIHIDNPYGADPLDRSILEQAQRNMFGDVLSNDQLASLVGAPPGAYLEISPRLGLIPEQANVATNSTLHFDLHGPSWNAIDHPHGPDVSSEFSAERYLRFDERNQFLVMDNVGFHVREDLEGQGYGIRIFADEVDGLSKQDVRWIATNAAGEGPRGELASEFVSSGNGYYTWPRFGYTGSIPSYERDMLQDAAAKGEVPASFGRYTTLQQLMRTPEGRVWWKEWGSSVDNLRFDLRDGSLSQRVLSRYLDDKGLVPGSADYWRALAGSDRSELALREGEGAAAEGRAAEDALTARIDRIPADATVPDIQDWLASHLTDAHQLDLSALPTSTRDWLLTPEKIAKRVDLMALDPQTARLIANATVNLTQALPEVLDHLYTIEVKDTYTEALAFVPHDGLSIIINTEKWTDLAGLAERSAQWAEQGWWVGQTPEEIIGHEIGHAVQVNYKISNDTWVAAMDRVAAAGGNPLVSQYAGRNVEESFAETFALLVYGTPTDAQLPVVREMAQLLRDNGIDYNALRAAVGALPFDDAGGIVFSTASAESEYHRELTAIYDLKPSDIAFLQDAKQQIAALDQSALTHDQIIDIGSQLHGRIQSDLPEIRSYADEAAQMRLKGPENFTEAEMAWARGEPDALAAHSGVRFLDAQAQYQAEYQARVAAYLGEVRAMGGDITIAARGGSEVQDRVYEAIRDVQANIPSSWITASNDLGKLTINEVGQQARYGGYYSPFANGNGRIAIDTRMVRDPSVRSTFLHEMMHRMEQVVPQIGQMEAAFYDARTAGDALVPLTNGIDMNTKLDQWMDQYIGRAPIDYSPWGVDATTYELLSIGAEAALGGGTTFDLYLIRQDEEFMAFILGLLATVEGG